MPITIEKLVYGGAGLARTENGVVFVHRTVPGDVVEVEITDRKKDYAIARLVKILEPGPARQEPTCPNYHTAGCCHWQHVNYSKQVDFKEEILRETLHRAGRIDWDKEVRRITGPDAHYRLRAAFHVRDHQLGFVRERSSTVVPIGECNALTLELNAWIPEANRMLGSPEMSMVTEVHAIAGQTVAASFASSLHQFGDQPSRVEVNGFTFDLHPNAFFQSNQFLLNGFMTEVLDQAGPSPKYVLDLYCGSGFFAIPLARRCTEIIGVESNRTAIKQAKKNARLNDVWNATFVEGQVDVTLDRTEARPDLIILNPPRAGCGKDAAEKVAGLRAARVIYVSCNPSTFAREAAILLAHGYELNRICLIDQFPNTYHIEMAAQFGLK